MMLREEAISPPGRTANSLHHNNPLQSGLSLMRPHGNRASSVWRRWRGGEAAQKGGRWSGKGRKRWREDRYLLSFHSEDFLKNADFFLVWREKKRDRERESETGGTGWRQLAEEMGRRDGPGPGAPGLCSAERLR